MNLPILLLLDDTEDDVFLLRLALRRANLSCDLRVVNERREAIDYLRGSAHYGDRLLFPLPAVMIINLRLPALAGFDVLSWIREQPRFKDLPVVIVTNIARPVEEQKAHALHATRYLEKSHDFSDLTNYLKSLLPHTHEAKAA
jgi:CheY-like chemotaxis protein